MRVALLLLVLFAVSLHSPAAAQTETPILSVARLSVGAGFDHEWEYAGWNGVEAQKQFRWAVPIAYTLPTKIPTALTFKLSKGFSTDPVRYKVGVNVVLFQGGKFFGGQ